MSDLMTPNDLLKLLKRARAKGPVSFGFHSQVSMPTDERNEYPWSTLTILTMKQAERMLADMQRFHDRKVESGQAAPLLSISDTLSEYDGKTRFIYWG